MPRGQRQACGDFPGRMRAAGRKQISTCCESGDCHAVVPRHPNEVQRKIPMGTDWRKTLTPEFTDDSNGSTCDPIPWPTSQDEVNEFTDTGVLIPYKEFLNCDGFELVESLGHAMEGRVEAETFRRQASDY